MPSSMRASRKKQRTCKTIDQIFEMHTGLRVCVERKHMIKQRYDCINTRFGHGCNNVNSLMLEAMDKRVIYINHAFTSGDRVSPRLRT